MGDAFRLPAVLDAIVRGVEHRVRSLPGRSTQADVCDLLRSVGEGLPGTSFDMDVFGALVTVFYANDCISRDQARELLAPSGFSRPERPLRDLLEGEE